MTETPHIPTPAEFARWQPPAGLLDGRVVLVTGASDGIGRALALEAASLGATLVLLGRSTRKLERVYDAIVAAGGPEPALAPLDFARAEAGQYQELVRQVETEFGRLDGLCHLAGILGTRTPLAQYDVTTWHEVLHVNLNAPFVLTQMLLPLLEKSADASVIFASSGVGRTGRAYWGAYAVSKFAVEGLSQVLADETATAGRIRVNCVNPGRTRTRMRAAAYPGEDPATLPEPKAVCAPFLYLLGPDGRGITGRSIDAQDY